VVRRTYRARISGPIADRIDITRHVEPVRRHEVGDPLAPPESSETVRGRVAAARARQLQRFENVGWRTNGEVPGPRLTEEFPLTPRAEGILDRELYSGALTRRGAVRVHRLAWTVADLVGRERPDIDDVDVALRLRRGEPLPAWVVERREQVA
jgi:magnesium chelatase family protein